MNGPEYSNLVLEFLPNPGGEDEGLGHAGIETFRHAPYASAAREAGQNSRDASSTLPVRVSYDVLDLRREEVPCIDALHAALQRCLAQATGDKEKAFFHQALRTVLDSRIKMLRISDFNTVGAKGPSRAGTPFHSLLKGSGVSVKDGIAAGGSFGIGKNAAFAISDLQAVFFSTVYANATGANSFLSQGKVVLVSHEDSSGVARRQTGYWGGPNFQPVSDPNGVPMWLRRAEPGTSIFVIGFRETPDWPRTFLLSLLQNFFPAIASGEMEFSLDAGRFAITRTSIGGFFSDPALQELSARNDQFHDFELAHQLYRCLTESSAHETTIELPEIGRVRVRVILEEGFPKKVFLIRNGMVITDSLEHFGDKFSRFPMYKDFVALALPSDDKGSAFLKVLEDPKHRELSAERIPAPSARSAAKAVMKRLASAIRETIKNHALASFEKEVSLDEMRQYFATPTGAPEGAMSDEDNPEKLRYEVRPNQSTRSGAIGGGQASEGGGYGEASTGIGPNGGAVRSSGGSGRAPNSSGGGAASRRVELRDLRNVIKAESGGRHRTVYFTSDVGGEFEVVLFAVGINSPERLSISAVRGATLVDGRLFASLEGGVRAAIDVELAEAYVGPLDVAASVAPFEPEAKDEA